MSGIPAIMMNAGVFLVPAIHEIAVAAELAIATEAGEKPNAHALTRRPTSDTRTRRIDPPNDFMPWDARPIDRKQGFHCSGIGVENPTRLDANAHLTGTGIQERLIYFRALSRSRQCNCSVRCVHLPPI